MTKFKRLRQSTMLILQVCGNWNVHHSVPLCIFFSVLLLLLLLSLNAHNHVDDYSGTLGGVRKVDISALVTSPKN